jgi:hypothetical protein
MRPSRAHYTNTEFDLSLRARPARLERPALARQVRELSAQALLGAEEGDAALLCTDVPEAYLSYLDECGVTLPRLIRHPELDPALQLRPFGWSAEAMELNRRQRQPVDHPALETIRRINGHAFSAALEQELTPDAPRAVVIDSLEALESLPAGDWVAKGEHGNAGLANRRMNPGALSDDDRRFIDGLLAEDDVVILEPWLDRERDWSVVFEVPFDAGRFGVHETACTRDGALVGAFFEPGGPRETPSGELRWMMERVARRLEQEGYFGPVCVDAFSWRDGERLRLRPLVDLNGRRAMSDGARRLWRRLAPQRTAYYRFFNRKKLSLPTDPFEARTALGELHFDSERRRGLLLASPLEFTKLAVILFAADRAAIRELERAFRARFEV